jgi:DNA-binding CsgD family transcriptional regulator
MEFIISPNQRQVIYNLELNIISNIKFTRREIDIIACVVHNRGEKKIASLLFISPRTVGTHVHNIMLKIGHSSREYLIDFIVKSGKLSFLKHYYLQILIESLFNDYLIKIGELFNKQPLRCSFKTNQVDIEEKNTLEQLKGDLELAKSLFNQALNIYKQKKHPEAYISLENLSSLFLKKYEQEINNNNIKKADSFKKRSLNCLTQALEIVTKSFPYDSVHIQRIQSKLKNQNIFSEIL